MASPIRLSVLFSIITASFVTAGLHLACSAQQAYLASVFPLWICGANIVTLDGQFQPHPQANCHGPYDCFQTACAMAHVLEASTVGIAILAKQHDSGASCRVAEPVTPSLPAFQALDSLFVALSSISTVLAIPLLFQRISWTIPSSLYGLSLAAQIGASIAWIRYLAELQQLYGNPIPHSLLLSAWQLTALMTLLTIAVHAKLIFTWKATSASDGNDNSTLKSTC